MNYTHTIYKTVSNSVRLTTCVSWWEIFAVCLEELSCACICTWCRPAQMRCLMSLPRRMGLVNLTKPGPGLPPWRQSPSMLRVRPELVTREGTLTKTSRFAAAAEHAAQFCVCACVCVCALKQFWKCAELFLKCKVCALIRILHTCLCFVGGASSKSHKERNVAKAVVVPVQRLFLSQPQTGQPGFGFGFWLCICCNG